MSSYATAQLKKQTGINPYTNMKFVNDLHKRKRYKNPGQKEFPMRKPKQGGVNQEKVTLTEEQSLLFSRLDSNSDNAISIIEFTASWHDAPFELWDQDDANADGKITKEEFGARNIIKQKQEKPADHFVLIDEDNDGCITQIEFEADWHMPPEGLYQKEDANGDGCIIRKEFGQGAKLLE